MSEMAGWLNTSKEKGTVWVKPKDTNTLVTSNIFVNLESKDAMTELVELLRDAFVAKTSYEFIVETGDIKRSKGGSLYINTTLKQVLMNMKEYTAPEPEPVDPEAVSLARSIRANLASRPKREVHVESEDDDDLHF